MLHPAYPDLYIRKLTNQKFNKMKTTNSKLRSMIITMFMLLFILGGCKTGNDENEKAEVSKPEAPSVDIHTSVVMGDLSAIRKHIAAGTDLDSIEPAGGSTALITAIVLGKSGIATALIEGGADINISNNDGSTPLYCAAFFGRTDMVKILLEHGADKNIRNNFGSTALESVTVPFESIRPIYDQISKDMGPLGFKLDYEKLREARVEIASLLQ